LLGWVPIWLLKGIWVAIYFPPAGAVKTISGEHMGGVMGLDILPKNFEPVTYGTVGDGAFALLGSERRFELRESDIDLANQPAQKPTKHDAQGTAADRKESCDHISSGRLRHWGWPQVGSEYEGLSGSPVPSLRRWLPDLLGCSGSWTLPERSGSPRNARRHWSASRSSEVSSSVPLTHPEESRCQ
jgi:hypothetical protein